MSDESQGAWDDLADPQRYGWLKYGRAERSYAEARRWHAEFEASLSPQEKLRRKKEAEASASDSADRALDGLLRGLDLADDNDDASAPH